jgi:hypothetical protein
MIHSVLVQDFVPGLNHIGGVMVSVRLALSAVDPGFIGGVIVSVRLA